MEKDVDIFLQAEETAVKLVEALQQLQSEASSYRNAKEQLNTVSQRILDLAKSMEELGTTNHEIIKQMLQIGSPEIFKQLDEIDDKIKIESDKISNEIDLIKELDSKIKIESDEIFNQIDLIKKTTSYSILDLEKKVEENFAKQNLFLSKIKKLVIATLVSSLLAIIIGIINMVTK
jgi:wobble nucleotide-excising tRNase